ncbi:MAG TPA: amino acid adenylation domain-containing protein [Acidobacteriota bacterium]|nr:amino acid adenylation domain-containing protein [Acidobacteriota bacterium]
MSDLIPGTPADLDSARTRLIQRMLRRGLKPSLPDKLVPIPRERRIPLSSAQARIWFFARLFPDSAEYNLFETLRLPAAPGRARLEMALRTLMERHDALRLRITEEEGEPLQQDSGILEPPLQWHDLTGLSPKLAERAMKDIGDAAAGDPLPLEQPPLFRVCAILMPGGEAVLVLVFHHLIADYWSAALLLQEMASLLEGEEPEPPGDIGFLDFVAWQQEAVDRRRLDRDLDYWLSKLGGQLPVLDLPGDRPRPPVPSRRGRALPIAASPQLVSDLKRLAEQEATSLFVVTLSAYKVLLLRLTAQSDLIAGAPLAGRDHPLAETLVGCFVKTVALRTDLSGDPSFREAVGRTHATVMEAQDHQSVPFDRVVAALKVPRESAYSPVFQTFFGLQSAADVECRGAEVGGVLLESESAKWDLTVSLTETPEGLCGFLEYSSDLFEESTAARFVKMYLRLLSAMAQEPDRRVGAFPLISTRERDRILNRLNPYRCPEFPYRTMAEPFEEQVERTPQAWALAGDEGRLTYADLNRQANRLAHYLRGLGAGRNTLIALCLERGFALVAALYAVTKSGAAYVPLDPELPDGRLQFMIEDTRPLLVLADRSTRSRLADSGRPVIAVDEEAHRWSDFPSTNPVNEGSARHLIHLLYTSGSTGRPKAVAYPVEGALANIFWLQKSYPFGPGDAALFKTSYGFDVSIWEIFWPLYRGATLVVCQPGGHRDPLYLIEQIERYHVTTIFLIPTMMQVFLDQLPAGSCPSLRWVFCGGEPVTPRIRDGFYQRLEARLINCYGPTEAGCVTDMVLHPDPGSPTVPLGRPAPNFRVYVLDERLQVLPVGVPGEAYLGGEAGVAQCYFRRPALTAERFLPDPYGQPGGRMYRTGDLCRYRDDGVLEHLGRIGRQVKVRGMRIEPAEIEAVLCEHPAVEESVVLPVGKGSAGRIIAFIVPAGGDAVSPQELIQHAGRILPRFMLPESFISVDSIPANVNGKTDQAALLRLWQEEKSTPPRQGKLVPPADVQEQKLLEIFQRVLGLSEISVTDSFFELGGHSLLIFKLIAACSQELGLRPSVADVFAARSVRALAQTLKTAPGDPEARLVPLAPRPGKPVIVFVHAASGSVLPFMEVAKRLGDYSIFGLQAPDTKVKKMAHSIENLSARYTEVIDSIRNRGPLIVAGWSMGGCIALEMARRWRQRKREVAAVLMLDTWLPPGALASPSAQVRARTAIRQMDVLGLEGFISSELQEGSGEIERLSSALELNRDAFLSYQPRPFEGEVFLLRAAEPFPDPSIEIPQEYSRDGYEWGEWVGKLVTREIPGNHFTLMAKDNAQALAATIRDLLDARVAYTEL